MHPTLFDFAGLETLRKEALRGEMPSGDTFLGGMPLGELLREETPLGVVALRTEPHPVNSRFAAPASTAATAIPEALAPNLL